MALSEQDIFWVSGIEMLAAKGVYKKFRINRYELHMLCCLQTVLSLKSRKAIAVQGMFEWIGFSYKMRQKSWGYIIGLINKGCVHRLNYKMQPTKPGNSIALTEFGAIVLGLYYDTVKGLERQKPQSYQTLKDTTVRLENILEDLPRYNLIKAGRDS